MFFLIDLSNKRSYKYEASLPNIPRNYRYLHYVKHLPFACHGYRVDKRELRRHADVSMYIHVCK